MSGECRTEQYRNVSADRDGETAALPRRWVEETAFSSGSWYRSDERVFVENAETAPQVYITPVNEATAGLNEAGPTHIRFQVI